jgi:hypothetical protein
MKGKNSLAPAGKIVMSLPLYAGPEDFSFAHYMYESAKPKGRAYWISF